MSSKAKHKTVTKYVVLIERYPYTKVDKPVAKLVTCQFIETAKQLRLVMEDTKEYRMATRAIGHRTTLPIDTKIVHDSPMRACREALYEGLRQVELAQARLKREQEELVMLSALQYQVQYQVEADLKLMA